jgi:DNA-binding NtrC family response regulator/tetratricopeptide (TPR) repeat protein
MGLSYETAARLFTEGNLLELIEAAGTTEAERRSLEPRHRVVVANALALVGELEEAQRLAQLDCRSATTPAIRSQAEWTLGLAKWRAGDISVALEHARIAIRLANDSKEPARIAWAHLHWLRLLVDSGPIDAIMAALTDVRRVVARAGVPQATAYLHSCVAVLEGQTGRLDEARRHLDIADSLLRLSPNTWLTGSLHAHRGSVACAKGDFEAGASHFRAAIEISKKSGYQQIAAAAETSLGYVEFLLGKFEQAKRTAAGVIADQRMAAFIRLAAADTLARVHLALGELDSCEEALRIIETQVRERPELALFYHVRWAAIPRARLMLKRGRHEEALAILLATTEQSKQLRDRPLDVATHLAAAQALSRIGNRHDASVHLLSADGSALTTSRDVQAQYYYASAFVLRDHEMSLASHLRRRALRLWADQAIVPGPLEMDDEHEPTDAEPVEATAPPANTVECVADSLAAFSDLAHRPRLLGEEMLSAIGALGCSPDARIVETREKAEPLQSSADAVVLALGVDRGKRLTLACAVPDEPVKAVLLADVLRVGCAAVALERAREEERNRAALWPAPPIEEQAGVLFLAEEMQVVLATVRRVAPTTVPVLITGETGTGKEVVARTIHAYSARAAASFRPFNCSGVPKDMLDSQLFGHRRGSFTGATEHFPGVIRAASGGTLFLDEIGETTLEVQPKLLRFLESNEVHPIGEVQPVRADVRIIAATNTDLDALVAQGRFRDDLFYRLNIVRLHLPPLRERRVEIPPLAHHYLHKHAQEYAKGNLRLAEETMEYLVLYRWPGNIRQLANEMRRMAALAEADAVLMPEHLSPEIAASRRTIPPSERTLDATEVVVRMDQPLSAATTHLECAMIQRAMRLTGGRLEEAAAMLGLSRKGLYLKRVRYGLEPPEAAAIDVA